MIENFIIIKIFSLTTISFVLAIALTPLLTHYLYKYKVGKQIRSSSLTPIFSKLHQKKEGTPTMGGIIIWSTVLIIAVVLSYLAKFTSFEIFDNLNFLTRSQTLLPLGALIASACLNWAVPNNEFFSSISLRRSLLAKLESDSLLSFCSSSLTKSLTDYFCIASIWVRYLACIVVYWCFIN